MRVVPEGAAVVVLWTWLVLSDYAYAAAREEQREHATHTHTQRQTRPYSPLGWVVDTLSLETVAVTNVVLVLLVELIVGLVGKGPAPEENGFLDGQTNVLWGAAAAPYSEARFTTH